MQKLYVYFQDPAHAAMALGWAIAIGSEILPFTKGRANGLLQGFISLMTKAKAAEEGKK
jgi:hypothetical protein